MNLSYPPLPLIPDFDFLIISSKLRPISAIPQQFSIMRIHKTESTGINRIEEFGFFQVTILLKYDFALRSGLEQ